MKPASSTPQSSLASSAAAKPLESAKKKLEKLDPADVMSVHCLLTYNA